MSVSNYRTILTEYLVHL